ncbi:hypothetical protein TrVE_jg10901 [Triparma verrucosa]|uniref:PCI domain-containing protein n=2 Tax=Triparma TaxID=722752 RepID=A0A9W7B2M5_9STRA|nr:hypothetical protein TrST_g4759 [Triparma strigata]GMI13821.1 hypothetical protein TrVE_jg10901 [Triparma verrucosa]
MATKKDKEDPKSYPDMALAELYHQAGGSEEVKAKVVELQATKLWVLWGGDWGKVPADMVKAVEEEEKTLKAALETAREEEGETDILDAYFALASFYSKIGDKDTAVTTFDEILKLGKLSSQKKLEALMGKVRIMSFFNVSPTKVLEEAHTVAEAGGDWDKRNRLKVYKGIDCIVGRDFETAAKLLASCVKTFSCEEYISFDGFCLLTVILNTLNMTRVDLKKDIIDGPEIRGALREGGGKLAREVCEALHSCEYATYFKAVVALEPVLESSRYLSQHKSFIVREMVVKGYQQFLQSYKSVKLSSMAQAFGVTESFLDAHLCRFINAGRLMAKIDSVEGQVETTVADKKNQQYRAIIEDGDKVLNRVQRLSRVVDV